MHRIRFAMAPDPAPQRKLEGEVEADETYVGGKPRHRIKKGYPRVNKPLDRKTPVFAVVERNGEVRARTMPTVNSANVKAVLAETVNPNAKR
jgi:hypothetical protein